MELDYTIKIVALIALIAFIILSILSMVSIASALKLLKNTAWSIEHSSKELVETLKELRKDFQELKEKAINSMENIDLTNKQLIHTTKKLESDVDMIINIFTPLSSLVKHLHNKVAQPLSETAVIVAATAKAVSTFSNILTRKRKS